jgi:hypothetical protein
MRLSEAATPLVNSCAQNVLVVILTGEKVPGGLLRSEMIISARAVTGDAQRPSRAKSQRTRDLKLMIVAPLADPLRVAVRVAASFDPTDSQIDGLSRLWIEP